MSDDREATRARLLAERILDRTDLANAMTENELKQAVLHIAYRRGWAVYHVPQSTMRNGGGRGYPDLIRARLSKPSSSETEP
jgi:hypothetical protein